MCCHFLTAGSLRFCHAHIPAICFHSLGFFDIGIMVLSGNLRYLARHTVMRGCLGSWPDALAYLPMPSWM